MDRPRTKVAILFSGQATPDQQRLLEGLAGAVAGEVVIAGGLDGVGPEDLQAMAPAAGEPRIVTQLADGATVVVDRSTLTARLQDKIEELAKGGCDLLVCLTTCVCPESTFGVPALFATPLLEAIVRSTLPAGSRLGVVVPLSSQVAQIGAFWANRGYEVTCAAADPWGDLAEVDEAGKRLAAVRPLLVVMDCFAYSREHRERLRRSVGGLVLLPQEVLIPLALHMLS